MQRAYAGGGLIAEAFENPALRDAITRTAVSDLGDTVLKPVAEFTLQDLSVTTAGVELATTLDSAWRNDALLDALAIPRRPNTAEHRAVLDGLAVLSGLADGELELLMGETLDVFANRYDAWVTSLATRRLADQRTVAL